MFHKTNKENNIIGNCALFILVCIYYSIKDLYNIHLVKLFPICDMKYYINNIKKIKILLDVNCIKKSSMKDTS